jgi:hypothetical protein
MKVIFHGHVAVEKLHLYNKGGFRESLPHFEGWEVSLTLHERITTRSSKQNRYYWGVVVPLIRQGLKEAGYRGVTKAATHKLLKSLMLKDELVNEQTGEIMTFEGSTTNLSTKQFNEFTDAVRQWAAEQLGINIPEPNEQMSFEF